MFEFQGTDFFQLDEFTIKHGPRFHFKANTPVDLICSQEGVRRVIDNLIGNAIKYGSQEAPITVSISQANNRILITVHNFGGELQPDEIKTLFEPFRRAKSADRSGAHGWGIGLTLVKGIIEAHGGKVWVESRPVEGTTFFVELPGNPKMR